jgi:cytochrome c
MADTSVLLVVAEAGLDDARPRQGRRVRYCDWVLGMALALLRWLMIATALPMFPVLAQAPQAPSGSEPAMRGHGGAVRAIVVLPGGRVATAGFDSAIIVWDIAAGRAVRVLRVHDTAVSSLVVRADGCLVSGGEDARIAVSCGEANAPPQMLVGHDGAVSALAATPVGALVASAGWDRTVRLWDASGSGRLIVEHDAPVTGLAFKADGSSILSVSYNGQLRLTPIAGEGETLRSKVTSPVNGLARLADGHFLLACGDGTLREIDASLRPVRTIELPDGPLNAVAVAADGNTVATGGMRTPVTVIDRATGAVRSRILGPGLPVWALAFSPDGSELFTGGADRAVRRFDVATGRAAGPSVAEQEDNGIPEAKDRGAKVFRACRACHGLTEADTHLAGPTLHHIMGRRIASLPGYAYSGPLKGMNIVWTQDTIAKLFEVGPAAFTPGTKMPEQRITDPDDRKALVDWLARVTAP